MARLLSMYCVPADMTPGIRRAHSPGCLPQHVWGEHTAKAQPGKLPERHGCDGKRLAPGCCSAFIHSHDYLEDSIFPLESIPPLPLDSHVGRRRKGAHSL